MAVKRDEEIMEAFRCCVSSDRIPISFSTICWYISLCAWVWIREFEFECDDAFAWAPANSMGLVQFVYKAKHYVHFLKRYSQRTFATKIFQISEFAIMTGCIHFALWAFAYASEHLSSYSFSHFFPFYTLILLLLFDVSFNLKETTNRQECIQHNCNPLAHRNIRWIECFRIKKLLY